MATLSNNFGIQNNPEDVVFSVRELAVLNEIATVVSSATDISDVYSSFAALVGEVLEWDGIIVNTPCDDGRFFTIRVREVSQFDLPQNPVPLDMLVRRPAST